MSSTSKAWMVAAAIGGVEALKDQGFCRWNYALRSLHQHAKNHVRSASQAKMLSSSSSAMISNKVKEVKAKQSEESLRKVMYLKKMSSTSKAWLVAAAIGGVEALKDQGFCRWNYTLRSLHQHAKNHVRSVSQAKKLSSSSSAMFSNIFNEEKAKQSEESLRKVMVMITKNKEERPKEKRKERKLTWHGVATGGWEIESHLFYKNTVGLCWFPHSKTTTEKALASVTEKMSSASKAWLVAAAIGGVEALKDQGFCRWNYTLRSLHQHAKNHVRSASQAKMLSSSSSAMISNKVKELKAKQSEESLRKVMYLSCWGPY
ncbi:hypothetical protein SADUNF_Sadunf19G0107700 [Salix dunnii]|uniref:Wound-responsive family protein n=1 Tax=Salix dunnii TaxID=1413687 RepID=A0A835J2U8_9ROSI|nr:hypothetical protein SADUNF_Sadunf19G0107700 [Salix dunnii]